MNGKIAIVGMEAIFGSDDGLDEFDRTIFEGRTHSAEPTLDQRKPRRNAAGPGSAPARRQPLGAPDSPSSNLLCKAIEGSHRDGRSTPPEEAWTDVALIVVSERDPSLSMIGPRGLSRETSLSHALQTARRLLSDPASRGVIIGALHVEDPEGDATGVSGHRQRLAPGNGAGAVFLKRVDQALQDHDRIYATIDAVVLDPDRQVAGAVPSHRRVRDACTKAFDAAGVRPEEIASLEISGSRIEEQDPEETRGLAEAYATERRGLTCALGSIHANIERATPVSGLASLIKTALCLYHRYIAATPDWTGPEEIGPWEHSPFYVPVESRPWLVDSTSPRRIAAIHAVHAGGFAHWILSEHADREPRSSHYLSLCAPYCFPLPGDDKAELLTRLDALQKRLEQGAELHTSARDALADFQASPHAAYALMLVAHTNEELAREIQFMQSRLPVAFEKGIELKTPKGSYFTPSPLGGAGTVAFVYPGIGSAYVGLGQALFHFFPELHDRLSQQISQVGAWLRESELYPRSLRPLTPSESLEVEQRLREDIVGMCYCATAFCILYTAIMSDVFKVQPHSAIGYSWGEPGMLAAFRVWSDLDPLKDRLAVSPAFTHRLHRRMSAVREYWKLNPGSSEQVWESYTLHTTPSVVQEAIATEPRVFLTIINSPEEVVIAGHPEDCVRVIERIGCAHYPLALDIAIHCDVTRLEHEAITQIFTLPVHHKPPVKFFSSSCYKSIPITSKTAAYSIARAFCEPVDFPRLVNEAYGAGARIFIELGPRKFCCNMIERILTGKQHLAVSINVKGAPDHTSIVRVLSQLVSHRVSVDLTPLYRT